MDITYDDSVTGSVVCVVEPWFESVGVGVGVASLVGVSRGVGSIEEACAVLLSSSAVGPGLRDAFFAASCSFARRGRLRWEGSL